MALIVTEFTDLFWTRFVAMSDLTSRIAVGHRYKVDGKDQSWPEFPQDTDLPDTRLRLAAYDPGLWGAARSATTGRPTATFEWEIRLPTLDQDDAMLYCQLMSNLFAGAGGPMMGTTGASQIYVVPGPITITTDDDVERFVLGQSISVQWLNVSSRAETAIT